MQFFVRDFKERLVIDTCNILFLVERNFNQSFFKCIQKKFLSGKISLGCTFLNILFNTLETAGLMTFRIGGFGVNLNVKFTP